MKTAIVFYFNENGAPTGCKLACDTDQQEKKLQDIARRMKLAVIQPETAETGPHVCACGGKCRGDGGLNYC